MNYIRIVQKLATFFRMTSRPMDTRKSGVSSPHFSWEHEKCGLESSMELPSDFDQSNGAPTHTIEPLCF
jgi:hypothetical protein